MVLSKGQVHIWIYFCSCHVLSAYWVNSMPRVPVLERSVECLLNKLSIWHFAWVNFLSRVLLENTSSTNQVINFSGSFEQLLSNWFAMMPIPCLFHNFFIHSLLSGSRYNLPSLSHKYANTTHFTLIILHFDISMTKPF